MASTWAGWVRDMLKGLGFEMKVSTKLYMDDESAILLAEKNGSFARNKHVMMRRNYPREAIQEQIVGPVHKATGKMAVCVRRSRHRDYCSRRDCERHGRDQVNMNEFNFVGTSTEGVC